MKKDKRVPFTKQLVVSQKQAPVSLNVGPKRTVVDVETTPESLAKAGLTLLGLAVVFDLLR